jgi:UDP-N-acetylmuramoyl-tripeptide--D-alanyl-D-alanine ligase
VRAAIDVLAACPGPTALVLGDMGEVGAQGPAFHAEVGAYAKEKGIAMLLGLGAATPDAVQAFGSGGRHYDEMEKLVEQARRAQTILVKGSRFMRMERVVGALTGATEEAH